MRTLAEIKNALPQLSAEELMRVEVTLHRIRRERKQGIIFDDTYGVWTEDDQASVAAEAWSLMEVSGASSKPCANRSAAKSGGWT